MAITDIFNINKLKEMISDLQKQVANVTGDRANLRKEYDNLSQSLREIEAQNEKLTIDSNALNDRNKVLEEQIVKLRESLAKSKNQIAELNLNMTPEMRETSAVKQRLDELSEKKVVAEQELNALNEEISGLFFKKQELEQENKKYISNINAIQKNKEILKSIKYAVKKIHDNDAYSSINDELIADAENALAPTTLLKLQCMDVRQLRNEFNKNQRIIKETLARYRSKYTVKVHAALYDLMVIALEAELQNILINVRYNKLDKAIHDLKLMTEKYQKIAIEGNQSLAPTIKKFIGEIEYLFIRAIEIEYEYYVQKERIKEEQREIRERLRQDARERKELEAQRAHIEKEEQKYNQEIESLQSSLNGESDQSKINDLMARISELQDQLENVNHIKDEILRLQMGKAGNIYIISNKGSFGENIFKIGMTRRLDPIERVNELGSASVPFPFDVHAFIFSEDAVALEHKMHERLNDKRLNKVNMRKEFFEVNIDELENIVNELDPTSEFNKTMVAEQFNQSQSITDVPDIAATNPFVEYFDEDI